MSSVYMAVPSEDGWIHGATAMRLNESGVPWEVVPTLRPCEVARNEIGKRFEKSGKNWLVMVDADTVPAKGFMGLLTDERRKFAGSPYTMFDDKGEYHLCIGKKQDGGYRWARFMDEDGWQQWDVIGFGCVAMHRSLFGNNFTPFEPWTEGPHGRITEDTKFCEKVGIRPWTHPDLLAGHFREVNVTIAHSRLVGVAKGAIRY